MSRLPYVCIIFPYQILLLFINIVWAQPNDFVPNTVDTKSKQESCASVSGVYKYYGEVEERDKDYDVKPMIDASVFRRIPIRGNPVAAELLHDIENGFVSVRLKGDSLFPLERISFEQHIYCEEGWVTFEYDTSGHADGVDVSFRSKTRLSKDKDGSLLVIENYHLVKRNFLFFKNTVDKILRFKFSSIKMKNQESLINQ